MSFNDYLDRRTGDDLNPAGSGQWRGFSGYATGATARSKKALVPAAWLQFPYLRRDQYELGLEAGCWMPPTRLSTPTTPGRSRTCSARMSESTRYALSR